MIWPLPCSFLFFFNDTATTEIYTLSLHDALPISACPPRRYRASRRCSRPRYRRPRLEEHTSELQSPCNLVCRLLLEKKKKQVRNYTIHDHDQLHTFTAVVGYLCAHPLGCR